MGVPPVKAMPRMTHPKQTYSSKGRKTASLYRRLLLVVIGFLFVTVAAWAMWRVRTGSISGQRVGPDDPNALRLLYVRPDCGEQIYDAKGQLLGKRPVGNTHGYWWQPDELKREFVFQICVDGKKPLFPPFILLHVNGKPNQHYPAVVNVGDANDSWITLRCHTKLRRTWPSGGFSFGPIRFPPRKEPVRTVDAHITYHAGPRGPARATFVGPFYVGRQFRAHEDPNVIMQIKHTAGSQLNFVFSGPPPMEHDAPVIAYTEGGIRHFLDRGGRRTSSSQGFRWEYRSRDLSIRSITHITLDEKPEKHIYRGIKVEYPNMPIRTHPAFLDEIAERLDLNVDLSTESAVQDFALKQEPLDSPSQALRILDIAHGHWLKRSLQALQQSKPSDLTEDERKKLSDILASWVGSEREITACTLGIWAGWTEYADRALAILRDGDLSERTLRELAVALCKYRNPGPEQLTGITALLLSKSIVDPRPRNELIEYVFRHSGGEMKHLRRLAECDRPWIWSRIIQPTSRFREFLNKISPSPIIKLRIVAVGMDGWIDDADDFKPRAYDLLAEAITPEFVQKSFSDFDRMFRRFVEHTHADKGTEVLIEYLKQQLTEWETWQIDGRAPSNDSGIRKAVRQLNSWNNTNIGGLGAADDNLYVSGSRFSWQEIAASALHWARTGEDQSRMPPDWRMSDRDLRVIWYNLEEPEQSVIGLWPAGQDPNLPKPQTVMESGEDFLRYTIQTGDPATDRADQYHFSIRAGVNQRHSISREFTFTRAELPKLFDPGPTNMFSLSADGARRDMPLWKSKWEMRIEPGTAKTSVLEGTKLFPTWKTIYLANEPSEAPLKRVFSQDDN